MPVEIHQHTIDADARRAAERWGNRVGRRVTNAAQKRAPVDEGTLRSSISYTLEWSIDMCHITIGSPLDYAEYFHTGTGIYGPKGTPIVPVTRKALKFRWEPTAAGAKKKRPVEKRDWTFARSVKGMPANPFLINALIETMGAIERLR